MRWPHDHHILDAVRDDHLFAPWFKDKHSWQAWESFLSALFGLPMTEEQLAIYRQCTGRGTAPDAPAREGWLVVGRRGGKSFVLALLPFSWPASLTTGHTLLTVKWPPSW